MPPSPTSGGEEGPRLLRAVDGGGGPHVEQAVAVEVARLDLHLAGELLAEGVPGEPRSGHGLAARRRRQRPRGGAAVPGHRRGARRRGGVRAATGADGRPAGRPDSGEKVYPPAAGPRLIRGAIK